MGSSLGFLLSLFFSVQIVAYVGDLTCLQYIYGAMDNVATVAGHIISVDGGLSKRAVDLVENQIKGYIIPLSSTSRVGEIYEFQICREYTPIIISSKSMTLTVTRSVMLGYID